MLNIPQCKVCNNMLHPIPSPKSFSVGEKLEWNLYCLTCNTASYHFVASDPQQKLWNEYIGKCYPIPPENSPETEHMVKLLLKFTCGKFSDIISTKKCPSCDGPLIPGTELDKLTLVSYQFKCINCGLTTDKKKPSHVQKKKFKAILIKSQNKEYRDKFIADSLRRELPEIFCEHTFHNEPHKDN